MQEFILCDGFENEMMNWFPVSIEEEILTNYFIEKPVLKPVGFSRSVLNFIFTKSKTRVSNNQQKETRQGTNTHRKYHANSISTVGATLSFKHLLRLIIQKILGKLLH